MSSDERTTRKNGKNIITAKRTKPSRDTNEEEINEEETNLRPKPSTTLPETELK